MTTPDVSAPDASTPAPTPFYTARVGTGNHWKVMPFLPARVTKMAALMSAPNVHWWGTQETQEIAERGILAQILPAGAFRVWSDIVNITLMGRRDQFTPLWHEEFSVQADDRLRYHQAALLRHIETGVDVLAMNAHFANGREWANIRTRHARACVETLCDLVQLGIIGHDTPIIFTGDFNDRRRANEPGPARILKAAGLVDARDVIGYPAGSIDLVYGRNITFRAWSRIATPATVSDHDWFTVTADVGLGAPKPAPRLILLAMLEAEHGRVRDFSVASFEAARRSRIASRYTAIVQDWLSLDVTCRWSKTDQAALDSWRHAEFPTWPVADYTGSVGPKSMGRLAEVARLAGKRTYPVVK